MALKIYSELEESIKLSEKPLETAVRLAIAGNIIDLGVKTSLAVSDIEETIKNCLTADFDDSQMEQFKDSVSRAERILYITDNAGEIVFDKLLIEQFPIEKVSVAVRGRPVINDESDLKNLMIFSPIYIRILIRFMVYKTFRRTSLKF